MRSATVSTSQAVEPAGSGSGSSASSGGCLRSGLSHGAGVNDLDGGTGSDHLEFLFFLDMNGVASRLQTGHPVEGPGDATVCPVEGDEDVAHDPDARDLLGVDQRLRVQPCATCWASLLVRW